MQSKSFIGGLVLGFVVGLGVGALAVTKGCPPVPAPAAQPAPQKAQPPVVAPAPAQPADEAKP